GLLAATTNSMTIANPIAVANQGTLIPTIGPENVAAYGFNVIFSGAFTLNKTLRVNCATDGYTLLNGAISGAGDIIVNGSGATLADSRRVIFNNAASTFVGTVDVRNGGVADLRTATTGSANNALAVGAGCQVSMTFGGTRRFGALVGTGEITVRYAGGAATLEIGNGNASGTFGGAINDGVAPNAGAVSVVKVGTGTQIFNGASAYTAGTTINGGTLTAGNASAFGTGTITVNAGATLDRAGFAIANTIINNGGSVI
ncbi:MAG: autotransporter-associated beta strand repeat-containing protein, partial [Plesiomonas shigelloides]